MCFILHKIFLNSADGPVEVKFEDLDKWLLKCSSAPASGGPHFMTDPSTGLSDKSHSWIIKGVSISTPLDNQFQLAYLSQAAQNLLSGTEGKTASIRDLDNLSFVFLTRYVDQNHLCREIDAEGLEKLYKIDSRVQTYPVRVDFRDLALSLKNSEPDPQYTSTETETRSHRPFQSHFKAAETPCRFEGNLASCWTGNSRVSRASRSRYIDRSTTHPYRRLSVDLKPMIRSNRLPSTSPILQYTRTSRPRGAKNQPQSYAESDDGQDIDEDCQDDFWDEDNQEDDFS